MRAFALGESRRGGTGHRVRGRELRDATGSRDQVGVSAARSPALAVITLSALFFRGIHLKTTSDLRRYLEAQARILHDYAPYGLPDVLADGSSPDSYFLENDSASILEACHLEAARFGYDGPAEVPTISPRDCAGSSVRCWNGSG